MSWLFGSALKTTMVTADRALPGRAAAPYAVPTTHEVLGTPLDGPWPEGTATISFGMGCFWGAEKELWQLPGVVSTAAAYQGGLSAHPTYEEVCTGMTGHTEVVRVAYDPARLSHTDLLRHFWEQHDPTQGYRQGNDVGTQYRSAVYWTDPAQLEALEATRTEFAARLHRAGYGDITTEVRPADEAGPVYLAEGYHQQYLHKNPAGYCPVHATGVTCPRPLDV